MALALSTLAAGNSLACEGEAQIIASIARTEQQESSCKAFIKSVKFYSSSMTCPLAISEIQTQGVEVSGISAEACSNLNTLSGVVVQKNGTLILE